MVYRIRQKLFCILRLQQRLSTAEGNFYLALDISKWIYLCQLYSAYSQSQLQSQYTERLHCGFCHIPTQSRIKDIEGPKPTESVPPPTNGVVLNKILVIRSDGVSDRLHMPTPSPHATSSWGAPPPPHKKWIISLLTVTIQISQKSWAPLNSWALSPGLCDNPAMH